MRLDYSFRKCNHSGCYALNYFEQAYNRGIKKRTPCNLAIEAKLKQLALRNLSPCIIVS